MTTWKPNICINLRILIAHFHLFPPFIPSLIDSCYNGPISITLGTLAGFKLYL